MDWTTIILNSFDLLWRQFVGWAPNFLAALVVFVLGLSASSVLARVIETLVNRLKIDVMIEKMGAKPFFDRAGMSLNVGRFMGQLVFWFLTLAFLLAATNILGLVVVSDAIRQLLGYIPNVIVAALIVLASVVLSNFISRVVRSAAMGAELSAANFAAAIVRWAVFVFGLLAALNQLGIAGNLINILVTGFVAMLAIAGGLAFGLGGKEVAEDLLMKLRREIEE